MPVETTTRTVQAAGPLAIGVIIPLNFEFTANIDIQVIESDTDGANPVTKVLDSDYSLAGAGVDAGGTATTKVTVAAGKKWTISRVTVITQGTDYVENDEFPAQSHESALDKLTFIAQEFAEELTRAMRVPISGDPTASTELPPFEANKVFTVDATGKIIVMSDFDAGAAAAAAASAAAALVSELAAAVSAAAALVSETNAAASAATIIPDWTNKSGGGLVVGDVVITDDLVDDAVKTSTTLSDEKVGGVAAAIIANDAAGNILQTGETLVNIKGTVARGEFIRHSTTAKQAESAGTTHAPGVFGRAMAGGTDVLVKCLIFDVSKTIAAAGDLKKDPGEPQMRFLRGIVDSNGGIGEGTGFTVTDNGTGDHTVNHTVSFNAKPSVLCSVDESSDVNRIVFDGGTAGISRIKTFDSADAAADEQFSFFIVGEE